MLHLFCDEGHLLADLAHPEKLDVINGWVAAFDNWQGAAPRSGDYGISCTTCGAAADFDRLNSDRKLVIGSTGALL